MAVLLLGAGSGALFAKLDSRLKWARASLAQECADVPCQHLHARRLAIESAIGQKQGPVYLAIGDSLTEFAVLEHVCGRAPINAGIGWATVRTFEHEARRLADLARPDFVVIALGTNDTHKNLADFQPRMQALLESLASYPVILIPAPGGPGVADLTPVNTTLRGLGPVMASLPPQMETIADGVHLTAGAYASWNAGIQAAARVGGLCRSAATGDWTSQ